MDHIPEVDDVYSYKGNDYIVTRCEQGRFLTKDADSGNWHDAIEYRPASEEDSDMRFVRTVADFKEKFQQVEGEGLDDSSEDCE